MKKRYKNTTFKAVESCLIAVLLHDFQALQGLTARCGAQVQQKVCGLHLAKTSPLHFLRRLQQQGRYQRSGLL